MSKISIIDTGDNYIITQINDVSGYEGGIKLYSSMDISINEIITDIVVSNNDVYDFIVNNIGRVLSYNIDDTYDPESKIDIPSKLKNDIIIAADFYKIKKFWENLQYPQKNISKYDDNMLYNIDSINSRRLTYEDLLPIENKDLRLPPLLNIDTFMCNYITTPPIIPLCDDNIYIMFNSLYNIAIVIDSSEDKINVKSVIKTFPEFNIIITYSPTDLIKPNIDNLKTFFHKISFSNIDEIKKKNDAFINLYNISSNDELNIANITKNNEKKRIKNFIEWHYTLSSDPDKKMKANDLYKEIINHMCISTNESSAFKKRLAGYLIEFKLQKKRFSDAYYYFGIIHKDKTILSLDEIEAQRQKDKRDWFTYKLNINDNFDKQMEEKKILMQKMITGNTTDNVFREYF
jgi:hypothetical protein